MTLIRTAGSLAHEAVGTALSAARHPIGTAAWATGVAKGTVGLGVDVVRAVVGQPAPPRTATGERWRQAAAPEGRSADERADQPRDRPVESSTPRADAAAQARADLPGPDVVARAVPEIDELPEPVVIEAEPDAEPGEAFHNEPKAASRASAHGGLAGDREEAEGYVEEIEGDDEQGTLPSL